MQQAYGPIWFIGNSYTSHRSCDIYPVNSGRGMFCSTEDTQYTKLIADELNVKYTKSRNNGKDYKHNHNYADFENHNNEEFRFDEYFINDGFDYKYIIIQLGENDLCKVSQIKYENLIQHIKNRYPTALIIFLQINSDERKNASEACKKFNIKYINMQNLIKNYTSSSKDYIIADTPSGYFLSNNNAVISHADSLGNYFIANRILKELGFHELENMIFNIKYDNDIFELTRNIGLFNSLITIRSKVKTGRNINIYTETDNINYVFHEDTGWFTFIMPNKDITIEI